MGWAEDVLRFLDVAFPQPAGLDQLRRRLQQAQRRRQAHPDTEQHITVHLEDLEALFARIDSPTTPQQHGQHPTP